MSFQVNEYLSIWVNYFWKFLITFNKNHKKNCKPDSVNSPKRKCLLFICALHCCKALAVYPSVFGASNSYFHCWKNPIYLTLHRKEFTWFHYKLIYILSVALVLILRPTGVTRFAALWCPDFPTPVSRNQQAVFLVEGKDNEFSSFSVINYLDWNLFGQNLLK